MTARELATNDAAASADPSSSGVRSDRDARRGAALVGGRYRSLFVLGRGGMGTVEAALAGADDVIADPDHAYERVVALKRLLPDAARDKRRVDMFLREARLAKMLDHPNVVTAYDYGELDGELYLAMEYVEGQPLSRLLKVLAEKGAQMPPEVVAFVLSEVCRGLHAAHELADPTTGQPLQLVHRDISPQNVMLSYDGRVRLLDFGVAKIETENVTKTGEVKGKTAYMSPEQAMGDPLDRRSDLFGVGAILFECHALRRMWGDGTDMEVIRRLALENPPSLVEADEARTLPPELVTLHRRLVAREAKDRPASAAEVADALAGFVGTATKEDSEAALRTILDTHFADQAREQRSRLTSSLREVAPGQADELRESVLPTSALTPVRIRSRATATEPSEASPSGRSRARIGVALAAVGVVLVGWRMLAASPAAPTTAPTASTASAPPTPTTPPIESVVPPVPTPSASPDPTPTTTASAAPRPPPGRGSLRPRPPEAVTPQPPAPGSTATPPRPLPPPSAKPPDVFEHPF
jgi:serine/threonine protein kinase